MNRLDTAKRTQIVTALVEGMGITATGRLCDVTKGAVSKLLADIGTVAATYHDEVVRNLKTKRIQCDEIWSFVGAKERQIKKDPSIKERNPDAGDVWTWTAMDADSKLMISYLVGGRGKGEAYAMMQDIAARVPNRVQLTTDGLTNYIDAVGDTFTEGVDYGQLQKIYKDVGHKGRYSPPVCIGCIAKVMQGNPDPDHISTSYVERSNLTMRMHMRRFTRLTNAHSKKTEMHRHAVALHFLYYNFCKIHETLRVTPAMAAGIATTPWTVGDIVTLLERAEEAA